MPGVDADRRFPIDVEAEQQQAILGPTDEKSLTLITSAGEYDAKTGLYPEVLVVRARFIEEEGHPVWGSDTLRSIRANDASIAPITPRP